ncbi:oxidoreductase, 2OG-Fe(II) oxygenase family protein [Bacteriovorax sp. BSW11_IV]|uniref:isopenicillin N synthase family dioxygenase n=1 Tax=Bacteriovorax sp. BSW11_IV TaxID=1353529 RepID=UPI00038A0ABD|nr:2-oxoglutarate and iron-dependent oxygenase domain-containing protein [Bacteriovorax sp. BSW11_IV]EQC46438.1 oxidoreductase, 2OG-Fe(II) oxygenase family protein [Bacteriovorax sp. BSW11_IV]
MANDTLRKVPELSLMSYINGSTNDKVTFVNNLYSGLKDYGFIVLTDHTVDQKKVDDAYSLLKEFYALPIETKKMYCGNNGGQRGYTPFKTEHAKDNANPDLKEFWHVGRELAATSQYKGVYPENVWPTEIPGFKDAFMNLYNSMDESANILLEAIGIGLDVPKNFFADMVHDGNSILRAIHYPPTKGEDTKNSIRAAAHEDINLITMLVGATDSGLELLDRDGSWLPVQSAPGQIVVDTGDMMSRITNEVLPATTHRVVNPKDDGSERFSMPYFVHPHSNALLSCIASCVGEGAKYPDITAGDFLIQRLKEIGLY